MLISKFPSFTKQNKALALNAYGTTAAIPLQNFEIDIILN
jgi:hypothetical protein